MILLLALAGCPAKVPPPVFAEAPPPISVPEPVVWEPQAGDTWPACLPTAFLPGREAPLLDADGLTTCRGQVLPEAAAVELLACRVDVPYWRGVAEGERTERLLDIARCEDVAAERWQYAAELRRDNRVLRWSGYGLAAACLVVGVGIGLAAGAVAP